jgi:hypothetical protein
MGKSRKSIKGKAPGKLMIATPNEKANARNQKMRKTKKLVRDMQRILQKYAKTSEEHRILRDRFLKQDKERELQLARIAVGLQAGLVELGNNGEEGNNEANNNVNEIVIGMAGIPLGAPQPINRVNDLASKLERFSIGR